MRSSVNRTTGRASAGLMMVAALAALGAFGPAASPLSAQSPAEAEPCRDSPLARQLDFWIGTWDVYNPESGQKMGENVIEPMLEGCALLESWTGAGGSSGKSLNFYDPQRKTWRQVWVSDMANVLDYRHGEYRDGAMRFEGITIGEDGDTTFQKLLFFDISTDTVRQVFESSTDGEGWSTDWVGIYVRRGSSPDGRR